MQKCCLHLTDVHARLLTLRRHVVNGNITSSGWRMLVRLGHLPAGLTIWPVQMCSKNEKCALWQLRVTVTMNQRYGTHVLLLLVSKAPRLLGPSLVQTANSKQQTCSSHQAYFRNNTVYVYIPLYIDSYLQSLYACECRYIHTYICMYICTYVHMCVSSKDTVINYCITSRQRIMSKRLSQSFDKFSMFCAAQSYDNSQSIGRITLAKVAAQAMSPLRALVHNMRLGTTFSPNSLTGL
jgi:hypothetical protein